MPLLVLLTGLAISSTAHAWQVKLGWDLNDSSPDGYRVYMRQDGQNYDFDSPQWQGTENTCTITGSASADHYFVVRAYTGDNESGDSNEVKYTPPSSSQAPTADAGADQVLDAGAILTLDGSASYDSDDGIISYQWNQLSGPGTTISGSTSVQPSCTAPDVSETTTLVFELTVTDAGGLSSTGTCVVTINPVVDPDLDSDNDGISDIEEINAYGTDPNNADTDGDGFSDGQEISSGTDPKDAGSSPQTVSVWIEAEDGDIVSPMVIEGHTLASNESCIQIPDGNGTNSTPSSDSGRAVYAFNVPQDGSYVIWGRVIAKDIASNSFYVSMDGQTHMTWHTMLSGQGTWIWDVVSERNPTDTFETTNPNVYQLSAGTHTIEFAQREDEVMLDRILITNDLEYVPEGKGAEVQALTSLRIEAEDGDIASPMVIENDTLASNELYIYAPKGSGGFSSPSSSAGQAVYTFDIPVAGNYVIWGRVSAADTASNSFFVSVDGQTHMTWHIILSGKGSWIWDVLTTRNAMDEFTTTTPNLYQLSAGTHTIEFLQRESGAMLDQLLITNDLSLVPEP